MSTLKIEWDCHLLDGGYITSYRFFFRQSIKDGESVVMDIYENQLVFKYYLMGRMVVACTWLVWDLLRSGGHMDFCLYLVNRFINEECIHWSLDYNNYWLWIMGRWVFIGQNYGAYSIFDQVEQNWSKVCRE